MAQIKNTPVFIILIAILTACGVKKRNLSENTAIIHIPVKPNGLHITNNYSGYRSFIFEFTQKTLLRMDIDSLKHVPVLAQNMPQISNDGKTYTFTLRPQAKWDDGSSITSEDVIFTTKVILCPLTNNPGVRGVFAAAIKSAHATDDKTVVFEMHDVSRNNLEVFTEMYILQRKFWDENNVLNSLSFEDLYKPETKTNPAYVKWFENFNNPDNSFKPEKLTGAGQYKLTEWQDESHIIVEKKKNWWGENIKGNHFYNKPDKIIFKIIKDDGAAYFAIKNQNIDATNRIATNKLIKLRELDYFNQNYQSAFVPQYAYNYIGFNCKPDGQKHKLLFTDKKVRRAIAHLIPIEDMIKVMYKGQAARQVSMVSPLKKEYNTELKLIEFNTDKAKQLLMEAGWIDSDGDNIRDKIINGEKIKFSFQMNYMVEGSGTKEMMLMIKDELYKAGIEMIPNPLDFSLFFKLAYEQDFDALMGAWLGSAAYEDPMQLWHTSQWAEKGANFCGFGNAQTDSLIEAINKELDDEKYLTLIKEFQRLVYEEQPYVFLFSPHAKVAIHKRFKAKIYNEKPNMLVGAFELINKSGSTQKPITTQ